jgi:hypothetical protein
LRLLDNVCREIARNGLKKIGIVNAHTAATTRLFTSSRRFNSPARVTMWST